MQVATTIINESPYTVSPENVLVCEYGKGVPEDAELIGEFYTYDDYTTKPEPYDTTLMRVVYAAADCGSNVVNILEHQTPSVYSSDNHQLSGNFLYSSGVTSNVAGPKYKEEYDRFCQGQRMAAAVQYSGSSLHASVGYGRIASKVVFTDVHTERDFKNGLSYDIGYDYIFNGLYAIGITYAGFYSSTPAMVDAYQGTFGFDASLIAPTLSVFMSDEKLIYSATFGAGYFRMKNTFSSPELDVIPSSDVSSPGLYYKTELLWRLNKSLAIGGKVSGIEYTEGDEDNTGVYFLSVNFTARLAF